jgi:hypothetical protein
MTLNPYLRAREDVGKFMETTALLNQRKFLGLYSLHSDHIRRFHKS